MSGTPHGNIFCFVVEPKMHATYIHNTFSEMNVTYITVLYLSSCARFQRLIYLIYICQV